MRICIIIILLVASFIYYKVNTYTPIPQFTDEQMEAICIEEEIL